MVDYVGASRRSTRMCKGTRSGVYVNRLPKLNEQKRSVTMSANDSGDGLAGILRSTIVDLVRRDGPDLTARQMGVFLTCYLEEEAQTVRGLAAKLNVSKPAITRALDRFSELDLVRRKTDPLDRRSILVQRTIAGAAFLRDLKKILADVGKIAESMPS